MELSKPNLAEKYREERKELQAKIQQLKNSVPKNDKKRRKQINNEISSLQAELDRKYTVEGNVDLELNHEEPASETHDSFDELSSKEEHSLQATTSDNVSPSVTDLQEPINDSSSNKKLSKAQRRREKKMEAERERERIAKEGQLENNSNSVRDSEIETIDKLLVERGLSSFEVSSDGNCLYAAVCHQLQSRSEIIDSTSKISIAHLRTSTSNYLQENIDNLLIFTTDPKTGECFTHQQYNEYCHEVKHSNAWAGQLEIRALCDILRVPIEIIQAEGPPVVMGSAFDDDRKIILCYYRHLYDSGEHYNSVQPKKESSPLLDDGFISRR